VRTNLSIVVLSVALAACGGGGDKSTTAPQSSALEIAVVGPPNLVAAIHVTGPGGFDHVVTATATFSGIVSGRYTVASQHVVHDGDKYVPAVDTASVAVPANGKVTEDTVTYSLTTGRVAFFVSGLPSGVHASLSLSGPDSAITVTGTDTVKSLVPGQLAITANTVAQGTTTYGGLHGNGHITGTVIVPISTIPVVDTVTYAAMTGSIKLTVSAPPAGLTPQLSVTGPFAYSQSITAPGVYTFASLPLGQYLLAGPDLSTATDIYRPFPTPAYMLMDAESHVYDLPVTYALASGSMTVNIGGLPGGADAGLVVIGPDSVPHTVNATTTLHKLVPGDYFITAPNVTAGGAAYVPDNSVQSAIVPVSLTPKVVSLAYTPLDLSIDGMYITQASQDYAGTVPLIAGRDGFLRVFVKASVVYPLAPKVRVRWYASGVLVRTDTISAPAATAPVTITEGALNSSWNLAVPKSLIQPHLSVLADVDPANAAPELNESNNSFPANGVPLALDVRAASVFHVEAVPVMQRSNHLTGGVTAGNVASFFSLVQKIHPIPSYQAAVHAVYTTADTLTLLANDANGEWENVLNEMAALRVAESVSDSLYYYGVVHPGYPAGVAGIGFIGSPAAVGWDEAIIDQIAAHEIGHNWGRLHAPCGAPADVDPNWPTAPRYDNANIGVYGFDLTTNSLISPQVADIMSYCQTQQWSSDYTYKGVMDFRAASPMVVPASAAGEQPSLLVWGRMRGSQIEIEPAFEITTRPVLPSGSGAYTLEGLDAGGASLFRYAFDPHEIADLPHQASSFAFAIPLGSFDRSRLASLRLSGRGREVRLDGGSAAEAAQTGPMPASGLAARVMGDGRLEVKWDGANYRMALIRDARTGQVLSFARHGSVRLAAAARDLTVTVSNGVRSTTEAVRAQ
jgi:hypothetical protein